MFTQSTKRKESYLFIYLFYYHFYLFCFILFLLFICSSMTHERIWSRAKKATSIDSARTTQQIGFDISCKFSL